MGDQYHHRHEPSSRSERRLAGAAAANATLAVVQLIGGLAFASVALLADTAHQAVDALALGTSLVAARLARRPPSARRSFGWARADALGAAASALVLLASTGWLAVESVRRLVDPEAVEGVGVLVLGLVGVAVNGASLRLIGHGTALSIRAARLHLLTDLAGSAAVVVAAVLVTTLGWDRVDAVASLLITVLVVRASVSLARQAADVLLDAVPTGVDADAVCAAIAAIAGVDDVHHVHVRSIGLDALEATAHITLDGACSVHEAQVRVRAIEALLADRFGIGHVTVQVECHPCETPAHAGP